MVSQSIPAEPGIQPFDPEEVKKHLLEIPEWEADEDVTSIHRGFEFKDFKTAMQFVNAVARIAEEQNHHPDIHVFYKLVYLELTTHSAMGLTEKDFLLASKIGKLPETGKASVTDPYPYIA